VDVDDGLADACCCQGDGLASVGAADAFPVFGRIVEPTLVDAFWAAGAAAATLFAGLFSKWSGRIAALVRLGSSGLLLESYFFDA
jgi:hypothetical protein